MAGAKIQIALNLSMALAGLFFLLVIMYLISYRVRAIRKKRRKNERIEKNRTDEKRPPNDSHEPDHGHGGGHDGGHGHGMKWWEICGILAVATGCLVFLGKAYVEVKYHQFVPVVAQNSGSPKPARSKLLSRQAIVAKCVATIANAKTYPASPDSYTEIKAPGDELRICHDARKGTLSVLCKPYGGEVGECSSDVAPASYFYRSEKPIGVWFVSPYEGA